MYILRVRMVAKGKGFGENETVDIKEFDIQSMYDSFSALILGSPGSGKTSFCLNFAFFNSHRYPVARIFTGNDSNYRMMRDIFGSIFCSNYYSEEEHRLLIKRKKECVLNNGEENPINSLIEIFDDFSDDPSITNSKFMAKTIKVGSRNWCNASFHNGHRVTDSAHRSRGNFSYVVLFREPDVEERSKLYKHFGGICGSFEKFCELMDGLTGEFMCMVIDRRKQSNDFHDCIFWYSIRDPRKFDWNFGCKEFRDWNERYLNKHYIETAEV
jgi:hypothetical protein